MTDGQIGVALGCAGMTIMMSGLFGRRLLTVGFWVAFLADLAQLAALAAVGIAFVWYTGIAQQRGELVAAVVALAIILVPSEWLLYRRTRPSGGRGATRR